jgi:hypothetical protein
MNRQSSGWSRLFRRPFAAITAVAALTALIGSAPAAQALVPVTPDPAVWGANGRVRAIVETPDAIYLGGDFTALVGPAGQTVPRSNIAAINPATGAPLPFAPAVVGQVLDIAVSADGGTVFAVGTISRAGGQVRGRGAAFNAGSGALTAFNPRANSTVEAVLEASGRVYLGGAFTTLAGAARDHLAAVDLSGSVLPTFTATADQTVHDLALTPDGSQVVAGGLFDAVSGVAAARRLALLDPVTGAVTPMATRVSFELFAVTATGSQIFAAGGGAGGHVYAFDRPTRQQQWLALTDGDAHGVAVQNGVLYVGGHFTRWSGQPASHVAAVSPTTGQQLPWSIKVNSNLGVFILSAFRGHVAIGGDFTKINNRSQQHLARFTELLDVVAPSTPGTPVGQATGSTSALVSWPASTDDQVANLVYQVFRDGGSIPVGEVTSASTGTVGFADTGLDPGSTHTWRVRAFDGSNLSGLSGVSNPVTLDDPGYPVLTGLVMRDLDADGLVDRVVADFSADITCAAPCLASWTLANVPSAGALRSVTVAGRSAVLDLDEGSGPRDTAVGGFRISLAPNGTGPVDVAGRAARFDPSAPTDQAGPVPTDITSTDGAVDNVMEPGDTFTATFSEPINPASVQAANTKEFDQAGAGNDQLIIVGLTDGPMDLGSNDYVTAAGGTIVFADSTLTVLPGGTKIRSTIVGACSGTSCGATGPGADAVVTFRPEPVLTDLAGNSAVGSRTESEGPY